MIEIYTDISVCPETHTSAYAFVIKSREITIKSGVFERKQPNTNICELQCIANALFYVNRRVEDEQVTVYSDCAQAVSALKRNNISSLKEVASLVREIIKEAKLNVKFVHIQGHDGNPLNEIAHEHARTQMLTEKYINSL